MDKHGPQEFEPRPDIRSFDYDVLMKNLHDEYPDLFEKLLLAAERESTDIRDKQSFVHGFLYNFGLSSEQERTALLERIFALPSVDPSDGASGEDQQRSNEPGDDRPAA